MSFLWGGPSERPRPDQFYPRSNRWWQQYAQDLSLSAGGIAEIYRSSCQIASLLPDPSNWGLAPRPLRGLVVGAVQSGKTSSMIGVSSIALDQGFRIIVVLAGGKDDLRRQTARRFNTQLIRQRDQIPNVRNAFTLPSQQPEKPLGGMALPYSIDIHEWAPAYIRMRETLKRGEPCVFVIKKLQASLAEMRRHLTRAYDEFGVESLPTLVLDDECDDASVDRAGMPIPEAIGNLWRLSMMPPVAYVGYTATAAANLLQQPDNELYPEHFVYLLRYPGQEESSLTYREINPDKWYSGTESFYEAFGALADPADNFLVTTSVTPQDLLPPVERNESLKDAVRSYLVAGAFRLALQPSASFSNPEALPNPHSMLIQTSASMNEHERWLKALIAIWGGEFNGVKGQFKADAVIADLMDDEAPWKHWYSEFRNSRERLYLERPSPELQGYASWARVKSYIETVVRHVNIKAVNSDPILGQSLDYAQKMMADGSLSPPDDIYVVAIGGSKLSRGITLEGLCISYFTRWTPNPTEDTVLQISRWLGYRGSYLAFCRIFTTPQIYEGLQEIHENDRDLRLQLSRLMGDKKSPREAGLVLMCNPRSLPTAKLGAGRVFDARFSPYQNVFRDVESGEQAINNQKCALQFVEEVRCRMCETICNNSGTQRGLLSRNWTAIDVANLLDALQYSKHNPGLEGNPGRNFHRPPDPAREKPASFRFASDPYQVAAYLREWQALYEEGQYSAALPRFNVGVSYGETRRDCEPFDFPLLNREITTSNKLNGQWTGRSSVWRGDALFDDPDHRFLLPDSSLRGSGLNGLLLLYVIHKNATGRQGLGTARPVHTVTYGISIPKDGPALRRVTVSPP